MQLAQFIRIRSWPIGINHGWLGESVGGFTSDRMSSAVFGCLCSSTLYDLNHLSEYLKMLKQCYYSRMATQVGSPSFGPIFIAADNASYITILVLVWCTGHHSYLLLLPPSFALLTGSCSSAAARIFLVEASTALRMSACSSTKRGASRNSIQAG